MTPPCWSCGGVLDETRDGGVWAYRCTAHGCGHVVEQAERLTLLTAPWTREGAAAVLEMIERQALDADTDDLCRALCRLRDALRGGE